MKANSWMCLLALLLAWQLRAEELQGPNTEATGTGTGLGTGTGTTLGSGTAGLLAIIPAAFIAPSQVLDALLAISVVIHTHW